MTTEATKSYESGRFISKGGVEYIEMSGSVVFCIKDRFSRIIHEALYCNSGRGIAIVAVGPDAIGRWAAYMGASEDVHESEEATLLHVAAYGVKLTVNEAERFLPFELVKHLGGVSRYRD